jgi:hypothetical protein
MAGNRFGIIDAPKQLFDEQIDSNSTGTDVTLPTPSKYSYVITNASLASISGVTAFNKESFILINKTGSSIILKYDSGSIATNGFLNGSGSDISMRDGSSLSFFYSPTASRWVILGAYLSSENKTESIAENGTFSKPANFSASYVISSTSGEVNASLTPFGANAPSTDGSEIILIGQSDTNVVTILNNDASKGCILNGNCRLPKYSSLVLKWVAGLDRYVEKCRNQVGLI